MKSDITEGADVPKKPRLEKPETRSSPITVQTSKDLAMADLSSFEETSADDFAMEMGLACVVCSVIKENDNHIVCSQPFSGEVSKYLLSPSCVSGWISWSEHICQKLLYIQVQKIDK